MNSVEKMFASFAPGHGARGGGGREAGRGSAESGLGSRGGEEGTLTRDGCITKTPLGWIGESGRGVP